MAAPQNLVLHLLITAKDEARSVFGKLFGYLDDNTKVIAGKIREAFSGLFNITDEAQAFEAQLARVQSKSNASAQEMDKLKRAALDMGRQLGVSATDAAQGLEILTGAGLTVDQAISALGPTLRVMATEQVSAADAAGALTDTLALMGISLDQAARAGDVLQAGADATSTSVMEMAEAMRGAGAAASTAGLTLEQTATILTAFAKYGLKGSEAGTALKNMLDQLSDPTSKARVELAKLGQTSGEVSEMIDTLTRAGPRGSAAMLAFGDAQSGVNALLKTGVQGFAEYGAAMEGARGGLERAADTIGNTTAGALQILSAAWQQVKLALTGPLLEPIAQGAKALAEQLGALANSGVLDKIGKGIAEVFVTGGQQVIAFLKNVDWETLQTRALTTVATLKTQLAELVDSVQGKVQTVADWTTTVFSPVTAAIDGYRLAWYTARGEQEKAAEVQARIEATSAAVGRALSGTSGELGKNTAATQQKTAADEAATAAQQRQATAIAEAQTEIAALTAVLKDGGLSTEAAAVYTERLRIAQEALAVAQGQTTAAVSASIPETQKATAAAQGAATAADHYAVSWGKTAEGLPQVVAAHRELGSGVADVARVTAQAQAGMTEWNGTLVKAHEGVTTLGNGLPLVAQALTGVTEITKEYDRQIKAGVDNAANWRSGMQLNGVQMMGLRDAAQATAEKLAYLQSIQATLPDADRQIAAAKQAATQAQNLYTLALKENIEQQERAVAAAQRAAQIDQTAIDLKIQQVEAEEEIARAKGDVVTATRKENEVADLHMAKINAAIQGKTAQIAAYQDLIAAVELQLAADGELNASDRAQLAVMADTLTGLEQERQGLEQTVTATEALTAAKKEKAAADQAAKQAAKEAAAAEKDAADQRAAAGKAATAQWGAANEVLAATGGNVEKLNAAFIKLQEEYARGRSGFMAFATATATAADEVAEAYRGQEAAISKAVNTLEHYAETGEWTGEVQRAMALNSGDLESRFNLLDEQDFDRLRGALDSANDKLREMQDETQSAKDRLAELNAELLEAQGQDQKAKLLREQLDYQQQLAEIEAQRAEAEALGNRELLAILNDQQATLEKIHATKMNNLAAESDAEGEVIEKTTRRYRELGSAIDGAHQGAKALASADLGHLLGQTDKLYQTLDATRKLL